jgi:hypothetical protein
VSTDIPDLPSVDRQDFTTDNAYAFARALTEMLQVRCGLRGKPDAQMILRRDLIALGYIKEIGGGTISTGGGIEVGEGGPPDSSPPTPITGLAVTSLFAGAFVKWDAPTYTQGGGNAITEVYEAVYSGSGPLPTFGDAILIGSAALSTNSFIAAGRLGTRRHYWVKAVTAGNVSQATPTGGTNGVSIVIGQVGNSDLGAQIVEAQNIADGNITPIKFATGTNPVFMVALLPALPSATYPPGTIAVNTTDTKVYRVDAAGTTWTAQQDGADIVAGTIAAASLIAGTITAGSGVIANAAISTAMIQTLAVTDALIASCNINKLEAGSLQVGAYLDSSNYVGGTAGFYLGATGYAEFNDVVVRGTVYASAGTFAGSLSAATGSFAGSLSAATGSFAGSLSAATGSFNGTVQVGSSPLVSGTSMTGTGAVFNPSGTWAAGNSTKNISFNGTTVTINGALVVTDNLVPEAVTVQAAAYTTGSAIGTIGYWTTIQSVTIDSTGASVLLLAGFVTAIPFDGTYAWKLSRDGTVVFRVGGGSPGIGQIGGGSMPPFTDLPGAGSHTYTLEVYDNGDGTYPLYCCNRGLYAIEVKR